MKINSYGRTDIGNDRSNNEDAFLIDENIGLYLVCDGMGGHAGGEVASDTAITFFKKHLYENIKIIEKGSNSALEKMLEEGVQVACTRVYALSREMKHLAGMGTTFTGLLIRGNRGFVVHVGDSRLYMIRAGQVNRLTEDHTYYYELIKTGRVTPEQAAEFLQAEALTRAIGIQPSVIVDHLQFDILHNDTFVVASDGLINYLDDNEELFNLVKDEEAKILPDKLVDFALECGGDDNTTVIVIDVQPETIEKHAAEERRFEADVTFRTNTMQNVALFQHLTTSERVGLLQHLKISEFKANDIIIEEGKTGEQLHIVLDGRLSVLMNRREVAVLHRGDHFGEMSILTQRSRSATVAAKTQARIMSISQQDFLSIVQKRPSVGVRLLWNLAQVLAIRLDDMPSPPPPRSTDTRRIKSVRGSQK